MNLKMKKFIALICISFFVMKTHSQVTTTCATGNIKLKTHNHQYGTLYWEKSFNNIDSKKAINLKQKHLVIFLSNYFC